MIRTLLLLAVLALVGCRGPHSWRQPSRADAALEQRSRSFGPGGEWRGDWEESKTE